MINYYNAIRKKIESSKMCGIVFKLFRGLITTSILAYIFLAIGLYLFQDMLIFCPVPVDSLALSNSLKLNKNIEEIELRTSDNISLKGWFVKSNQKSINKLKS